jgi:hypothetical protein
LIWHVEDRIWAKLFGRLGAKRDIRDSEENRNQRREKIA